MKVLFLILAVLAAVAAADNWAILIAGSNSYGNYRHQSDVMHAYQILSKGGYPDDKIIIFAYGDIAYNTQNPVKGNVINKPNGPNVYTNFFADYAGENCTKDNFLAVLSGEASKLSGGSGKVLQSTSEDNVFINFADHGGAGLICFPVGDWLYTKELTPAMKDLTTRKAYKKLVFYLEACESGSMFDGLLPKDTMQFATTAANPSESSYAIYWDDTRQTYLGDAYSVHWMEDTDTASLSTETLQQQFEKVKQVTTTSHVMEYGDQSFSSDTLDNYLESGKAKRNAHMPKTENGVPDGETVSSRDVKLATLIKMMKKSNSAELKAQVKEELAARKYADRVFRQIPAHIYGPVVGEKMFAGMYSTPVDADCMYDAVPLVERACGRFNDYSLQYTRVLANLCEAGVEPNRIGLAAQAVC